MPAQRAGCSGWGPYIISLGCHSGAYPSPLHFFQAGMDTVAEVRKAFEFMKQALA